MWNFKLLLYQMNPNLLHQILTQSQGLELISAQTAKQLVSGKTSKPNGVDPAKHFVRDSGEYLLAMIPLEFFAPNDSHEAYDATVDIELAKAYATAPDFDSMPPVIAGSRLSEHLNIIDGGHRITALRMRRAKCIRTLIRATPDIVAKLIDGCCMREGEKKSRKMTP